MKSLLIALSLSFAFSAIADETSYVKSQKPLKQKDMRAPVHVDDPAYRPSNHYGRAYNWRDFSGKPNYNHARDVASEGVTKVKKSKKSKVHNPYR